MLKKTLNVNLIRMALVAGAFLVMLAPSAYAQGRRGCDNVRGGGISSQTYDSRYDSRYDSAQYYNNRYDSNRYNSYRYGNSDRYYSDSYYENENTTGKALKRVGIGAAIGAGAGVLLGGKTGAIVGAGAGGLGGYIYHRGKVNGQQSRYPY